jgi:hypothetical protein
MATTSDAIAGTTSPPHGQARDRRSTTFRVVAGLVAVGLLSAGMIVLFMLAPWTTAGPWPDDYAIEMHRWHHADAGALFGFLVAGSLLAAIPAPRQRPVLVQAAIVGLASLLVASLVDEISAGALVIPVVVTTIIIAAYPNRRELVSLRSGASISLPLLGLTVATAIPLLLNAWDNLQMQADDHSQHAAEGHWSASAAVAVALIAIGLLVASRRPGWVALGALLGATWLYLGVAALTIPDHDGSWGVLGGAIALVTGGAYLALTAIERRSGRSEGTATTAVAMERG